MNPIEKDPLQKRIEISNFVILGVLLAVSSPLMPGNFTLGIFVGGIISIANFYWLYRDLKNAFQNLSDRLKGLMIAKYYVRFAVTAVILYFVITRLPVDIFGLLVGLSLVVINIAVTAAVECQKKIHPEEVR
jgi:hypothetical protein